MPVAVVTDSTAYLPAELSGTYDLTVVPLTVVINGDSTGSRAPRSHPPRWPVRCAPRRASVSTSRPAPAQFVEAYRKLLDAGADGIVSVHLSSRLSGTYDAASLAAAEVGAAGPGGGQRDHRHGPGLRRAGRHHRRRRRRLDRGGTADRRRPRRAGQHPLLRGHPGVPAPRRPDRRGLRPARHRPVGEADPARGRRRRSWCATRSAPRGGPWPGWSTWRWTRPAPARWTSPCTTSARRTGRRPWPTR